MWAYISFDVSSLSFLDDVIIKDIFVTIPVSGIYNHPELAGSRITIQVVQYGGSLELSDQTASGDVVETIDATNSLTNFDSSNNKIKEELQKVVDTNEKWFQLKIKLSSPGVSYDGIRDYYKISISDVVLHIKYKIPG